MDATCERAAKTRQKDFKLLVGPPRRLGGAKSELKSYEEIEPWFSRR
jgi:hypothetical protein